MALSTSANKVIHDGNGVATSFAYTFPILEASHLQVIYTDAGGNAITLSPSLYSVTGIGSVSGGAVTYPLSGSPLASAETLTLLRTVPLTQLTVFSNQGGYYPEIVEGRFDRVYMGLQQLSEEIGRATIDPPSVQRADVCETLGAAKGLLTRPAALLIKQGAAKGTWGWFSGDTSTVDDVTAFQCTAGPAGRYKRIAEMSYFHPKDFGVVFGAVDDTAAMQACIDAAQKVKGTIVIPHDQYPIVVTGLTIGVAGTDQTCHFISSSFDFSGASYSGNPYQYIGLGGFKLKDGSNTHLFTILKDASPPRFTGLTLMGNKAGQSGTSWVIYCENATGAEGHYTWACHLDHCKVTSGLTGGVYIGDFRGGLLGEKTWFQYCGTLTTDHAIYSNGYDIQLDMCGFGSNPGVALYLFGGVQVQLSHNVFWQNFRHIEIMGGVSDVGCVGDVFDWSYDHAVVINGAMAAYAHGSRTFTGCKSRRNSATTDNSKSDFYIDSDERVLIVGHDFQGKAGEANGPKYNIETAATVRNSIVQVVAANYRDNGGTFSYGTAFTNSWPRIAPAELAQIYTDANYTYIGGNIFGQSLRVKKNAGAISAWIDAEATNSGFAMVRAETAGSNARLAVFGKGTGGTQLEVSGGYLTFFGGSVVAKQAISGSLSTVAAADVKALLTSIIAALQAYNLITNSTT